MNRINTHMGTGPARECSIQVESTSIVLVEMELQTAEPDHEDSHTPTLTPSSRVHRRLNLPAMVPTRTSPCTYKVIPAKQFCP